MGVFIILCEVNMNNFYAILRIIQISDIIFDYYNKCKLSYEIICIDTDCIYNSKIIVMKN